MQIKQETMRSMGLAGLAMACLAFTMALFQGCCGGRNIIGEGFGISGIGVVSDTTALIAGRYFEEFEDECSGPAGRGDGRTHKGWGLKLVDVRKKQVYWEADVKDEGDFIGAQVTDSIMALIVGGTQQSTVSLWLWKLGQNNPVHHQLTWTTEPTEFKQIKPWKNGLLLAQPGLRDIFDKPFVLIDTAMGTIQRYSPSGDDSWMLTCADVKWNHLGGLCLQRIDRTCDYVLLREGRDTLGGMDYQHECSDGHGSFYGNYFGLFNNSSFMDNPYPSELANTGFFKVNANGSIAAQPSFWIKNKGAFVDSLGNVVEYHQ